MRDANTSSQEYMLLDYAQRLERHREDRRSVHFHLSELKPQNRREHHLRIAANTLEDFVRSFEGQIFVMGGADIVLVCKGINLVQLDDIIMRMRYLFAEDPLSAGDPDGEGHGRFATLYNIETQYSAFLTNCKRLHKEDEARRKRLKTMAIQSGDMGAGEPMRAVTPQQLGRLEEVLERSDLGAVLRRQSVCAIGRNDVEPKPVFKELFVSIMDLATTVLPDVDLAANRWLFQHLTQTLDRRVLKLLARGDDSTLYSSFSVNLNVSTLLSQEFLDFDSSLRMGSRGTLVIELQLIDIFSDFSAFCFARDFAREKGYRICLDGITHETLPFIDRSRLGVDLVKLSSAQIFETTDPDHPRIGELTDHVARVGKGRVILCRVDSDQMVKNGLNMGITMFQGHHVELVMNRVARGMAAPQPQPLTQRSR